MGFAFRGWGCFAMRHERQQRGAVSCRLAREERKCQSLDVMEPLKRWVHAPPVCWSPTAACRACSCSKVALQLFTPREHALGDHLFTGSFNRNTKYKRGSLRRQ